MGRRTKKTKKGKKIFATLIILVIIGAGAVLGVMVAQGKIELPWNLFGKESEPVAAIEEPEEVEKEIKIFNGDDRPIAVVLENSTKDDWPHPGMKNAYLVYEIIVEGGYTKLMPIYKGVNEEQIGYIRSARPYFIDYALENDAVLVHYGHTIMTADDEAKLKNDYIDGIILPGSDKTFATVKGYSTGYAKRIVASIESIKKKMGEKKFRTTSTDEGFKYVAEDYDLEDVTDEMENITNAADSVKIKYSSSHSVSYTYDKEKKIYKRFQRGNPHYTDNNLQLTAKNIIIQLVTDTALGDKRDLPDKGYRKLANIGQGTGYFITNGKYVEITWSKKDRSSKTIYKDKDGNEIVLNDGITYVQIIPTANTAKVTFE